MARVDLRRLVRLLAAAAASLPVAHAAQATGLAAACRADLPLDGPIATAAARFALPEGLVHAVIAVESNYAVFAVSPQGAIGLMQIMPQTWAELRLRYALGADPFDPCDNILAGTAYLREMLDRYGDPGFLAAYNAGPGRYEAYRSGARSLPPETIAYMASMSRRMAGSVAALPPRTADPDAWRHGGLFAATIVSPPETPLDQPGFASVQPSEKVGQSVLAATRESIFVPRTGAPQ